MNQEAVDRFREHLALKHWGGVVVAMWDCDPNQGEAQLMLEAIYAFGMLEQHRREHPGSEGIFCDNRPFERFIPLAYTNSPLKEENAVNNENTSG